MRPDEIDELLDRRTDGTLTPTEAEILDRVLRDDPQARAQADRYQWLASALDDAGEPAAPTGLVRRVMARIDVQGRIHVDAQPRFWIPQVFRGGASTMAKKVMIGLAAAAAVILVTVAFTGYPPISSSGTLGAIGAAKRAQAPQISAADVVTGDPSVQAFLQSDTFDRLAKDPDARKLLANASFRDALNSAEIRSALSSAELQAALARPDLAAAMRSADLHAALADANIQAALANADFRSALAKADLHAALSAPALQAALASDALQAAMAKPEIRAAFASSELQAAFARADFRAALASPAMQAALADAGLQAALHAPALAAAMQSAAFASALHSPAFDAALMAK